jgi:hypothetical protein
VEPVPVQEPSPERFPAPSTVFEREEPEQVMRENFFPDYLDQRPIDSPLQTPIGILSPIINIGNVAINGTSCVEGDGLCDLPLDPDRLRAETILGDLDYRNISNLTGLLDLVRQAFNGAKDIENHEYTNQSLYIDLANQTFTPFVYFIETPKANALQAAFKLTTVDSLYNFSNAEAQELGQLILDCENGGFVKYYNWPGFEVMSQDWFVLSLNVVAVSCQDSSRVQILYFSSLVEGEFLADQPAEDVLMNTQIFLNKWLWTQFLNSLANPQCS